MYKNTLKHYGVKGMRWGVRRYQPYPKGEKGKGKFLGNKTVKSKTRELANLNKARNKNMDKRTTDDLRKETTRLVLENDLKRLSSSSRVGTKADRAQYARREEMSDQELRRKVDRLRVKDAFKEQAQFANKSTIEKGKEIMGNVATVALPAIGGFALSKVNTPVLRAGLKNLKLKPKDIDRVFNMILK